MEDAVGGQAREGESRKLWLNQVACVHGCLIVTSLYGQCLQPPVTKKFTAPRSDLSFSSFLASKMSFSCRSNALTFFGLKHTPC